ncbi:hypothetical protein EAE96_004208 [Botrytis aclada]|nr:hypothetical protein EAE96_004208 [Botrytis aclada]
MNVGPGHIISTEEDMMAIIQRFAHAMSPEQYSELFRLYAAVEFEEELNNYKSQKDAEDPDISIHYFRVSRIIRDMLFTCSSIDFGYNMVKHTQTSLNPDFTGVRLYDLNQSTLNPLWKGAGMPYVKVSHGSDTNYIFNGVFPEGQLTEEDREFSERFTMSLINFAYSGNPISDSTTKKQFDEWPESFGKVDNEEKGLTNVNLQVIGGPYGTGSVALTGEAEDEHTRKNGNLGKMQQILVDALKFGSMDLAKAQERRRLIEQERLLQRCAYINSLADALGI